MNLRALYFWTICVLLCLFTTGAFGLSGTQHADRSPEARLGADQVVELLLTFQDDHTLHQFFVVPQQDFMIVKLTRISVADHFPVTEWEQGIQYNRTARGFWYPTRSYIKSHGRVTQLTRIDSFVLNPPPVSYCIAFTEDTSVYRYQGQTDLSFQGQGQALARDAGPAPAAQVIAGHILDVDGAPVAGASIQVCGDSHLDDYDSVHWDAQSHRWEIACLDNMTAITLSTRNSAAELELVVKPRVRQMLTHNILP